MYLSSQTTPQDHHPGVHYPQRCTSHLTDYSQDHYPSQDQTPGIHYPRDVPLISQTTPGENTPHRAHHYLAPRARQVCQRRPTIEGESKINSLRTEVNYWSDINKSGLLRRLSLTFNIIIKLLTPSRAVRRPTSPSRLLASVFRPLLNTSSKVFRR